MRKETTRSAREPSYQVVWPLGRSSVSLSIEPGPPISNLGGKTIGEVWNSAFKGNQMFAIIRERLRQRFPDVKFVDFDVFGDIHGPDEAEVIAALPGLLRQHGCDAVITGVGA